MVDRIVKEINICLENDCYIFSIGNGIDPAGYFVEKLNIPNGKSRMLGCGIRKMVR